MRYEHRKENYIKSLKEEIGLQLKKKPAFEPVSGDFIPSRTEFSAAPIIRTRQSHCESKAWDRVKFEGKTSD